MIKYIIAIVLCAFHAVLPMNESEQFSQKFLSIQEKVSEKELLLPKGLQQSGVNLALLRMDQIGLLFERLPQPCVLKVKKQMSPDMSFIHDVAMLPKGPRDHIILLMLDGDKEKAAKFYEMPLRDAFLGLMFDGHKEALEKFSQESPDRAFQLYHEIKKGLGDAQHPIGPLYVASQEDRDLTLQILNPWFYSQPRITLNDKTQIDSMDENLRRYFIGKEVLVFQQKNVCDPCRSRESLTASGRLMCGPVCLGGGMFGTGVACEACGANCLFLKSFGLAIGSFGSMVMAGIFCILPLCMVCEAKKVML